MATYLEIAAEKPRGFNWTVMNLAEHSGVNRGDATNLPLPYSNEDFNGIYSEHFIEHLYKYQAINFFKECFRVLKPGGVIRTVWPPYEFVERLEKFSPPNNSHRSKREQCALGLLHQKGQHLYLWSKSEMKDMLESLGYRNVRELDYQDSGIPDFKNIDTPGQIRALHSAVVEASKPWSL
mgnify:CR=1 FL=1